MRGDDTYRLYRAAADVARRAGDTAAAARDLATAATTFYRISGAFARLPPPDEAAALLATARELAGDDPAAEAAVALAECGVLGDAFCADRADPRRRPAETTALAERAVELARQLDDPLAECAALDALTGAQHLAGDTFAAAATARRRVDMLSSVPVTPASAHELIDALLIAAETSIGVGDLPAPAGGAGSCATCRCWPRSATSPRLGSWWPTPSPATPPTRSPPAAGSSTLDPLRPATGAQPRPRGRRRSRWSTACAATTAPGPNGWPSSTSWACPPSARPATARRSTPSSCSTADRRPGPGAARGRAREPVSSKWVTWIWLHWYVALRAEAAVLAAVPTPAATWPPPARVVAGNPVAAAIVERAEALLDQDRERLLAAAAAFDAAGCPYQAARTLILAGGEEAVRGLALRRSWFGVIRRGSSCGEDGVGDLVNAGADGVLWHLGET